MKIKILKSCSGYKFSFRQGDTVEVEERIGKDLIGCGFAEKAAETAETAVETDSKVQTDTAAKKTPSKARGKAVNGNA